MFFPHLFTLDELCPPELSYVVRGDREGGYVETLAQRSLIAARFRLAEIQKTETRYVPSNIRPLGSPDRALQLLIIIKQRSHWPVPCFQR
jgi:hypothetical protein